MHTPRLPRRFWAASVALATGITLLLASHGAHPTTSQVDTRALAESWGAVVRTYRVPSDALVAVREGACDVGLVDDAVWEPLVRFPEWKKFSSTLEPAGAPRERVWLLPAEDTAGRAWLASEMKAWNQSGAWKAMTAKWARDVAFDVYLDQEVPDCHG